MVSYGKHDGEASYSAGVIFLGGLAGQQRPRKGHAVADADGAHVQGERVERVHCLIGIVAVRGESIEHDECWRPGHSARPDDAARSPLRHAALVHGSRALGEPRSTSWPL